MESKNPSKIHQDEFFYKVIMIRRFRAKNKECDFFVTFVEFRDLVFLWQKNVTIMLL